LHRNAAPPAVLSWPPDNRASEAQQRNRQRTDTVAQQTHAAPQQLAMKVRQPDDEGRFANEAIARAEGMVHFTTEHDGAAGETDDQDINCDDQPCPQVNLEQGATQVHQAMVMAL
jgi:hypothetical protein